jgi:small-conductance mechanosensitive channel
VLAFVVISAVVFVTLQALRSFPLRYLASSATDGERGFRALIVGLTRSTSSLFLVLLALYCGSYTLPLTIRAAATISTVIQVAVLFQLGVWSIRLVLHGIEMFVDRQPQGEEARLATAIGAIRFIARVAVWALVGLLVLSALNINITALIAGLGIGGVAVALAAQNVLGDLFASLSILLDRPFAVGHFIVVGDMAGTVEHVGIKSTRIRSLSGEEVVQSNTNLLNARIHNYRHLYDRRVLFAFGVTYDTPHQKLTAIPEIVREIIQGIEKTRFDRAHFKEYGDSALNFEVVYYVLSPDYNLYMDVQQGINLDLFRDASRSKASRLRSRPGRST